MSAEIGLHPIHKESGIDKFDVRWSLKLSTVLRMELYADTAMP